MAHPIAYADNILYDTVDGVVRVYIADFGLARCTLRRLSHQMIGGTEGFRAPELDAAASAAFEADMPAADMYAVAVTLDALIHHIPTKRAFHEVEAEALVRLPHFRKPSRQHDVQGI
jgi:serine/threonine protein kinase